jgi:Sec-independent protein translocase protein TatA
LQLGPLEVGVVLGVTVLLYGALRGGELIAAVHACLRAFLAALRGGGAASAL